MISMFKKSSKSSLKTNYSEDDFTKTSEYCGSEVNGAASNSSSDEPGVLKTGYAKKLKTMKRKFFVLQPANKNRDAQLQYYDNEKKWMNNFQPKRVIILKDCFIINRRIDTKHQHALTLYTTDDCFSIVFETESVMEEWLQLMLDLQKSNRPVDSKPLPTFEYIWQVTVKNKGLGNNNKITGQYRLCLSAKALTLIKMGIIQPPDDNMEFPLLSVRRCGHSDSVFFMELGRSAVTGAGELWMQSEDTATAQNMHETILSAMKSSSSLEESSGNKGIRSRRSTNTYNSEGSISAMRTISSTYRMDNSLDNSTSGSFRQRTVSEGQHSLSKERNKKKGRFFDSDRPQSIGPKALSFSDDLFPRNNNAISSPANDPAADDLVVKADHHLSLHGITSLHKTEPTISEESETPEDYLMMDPAESSNASDYIPMDPSAASTDKPESYKAEAAAAAAVKIPPPSVKNESAMSAVSDANPLSSSVEPYVEMYSPTCSPVSSQANLESSDGYLYMSSGVGIKCTSPCSSLNSSMVSTDGYMNMSARSPCEQNLSRYHLDKVQSYISDLSDGDDLPIRSYSVGASAKSNYLFDQKHRTRAFSCGSHDDAAKMKLKGLKSHAISKISSEEHDHKSVSAPHLPGQKSQTYGGSRQEDLMELEFMPESVSSTSSSYSSINCRSRSGSKSSSSRYRLSGTKYRSCDTCEQSVGCACPADSVSSPTGADSNSSKQATQVEPDSTDYMAMSTSKTVEKQTPKMSPSLELVQHLWTPETGDSKASDAKFSTKEEMSQSGQNDEAGDYINIDFQYKNPTYSTPSQIILPKSTSGNIQAKHFIASRDYMNINFNQKSPVCVTTAQNNAGKSPINDDENAECSNTTNYPIKKQQSAPAGLPYFNTTDAKSPIRKSSCPVTSAQNSEGIVSVDKNADRKYSLEPPFTYENISFSSQRPMQSPFGSRPSSVCSELELNYASLDLAPVCDDDDRLLGRSSPRMTASQNSSTSNITNSVALEESESSTGLSYAKIDFTRSEGLRTTTNTVVESRH